LSSTGVFIRSVRRNEERIIIEWLGAAKRYQVQEALGVDQGWQNVGEVTSNLSFTNSILGTMLFFRIVGLPD
jgi:hypothetical protein